jgi:hypothetical protein
MAYGLLAQIQQARNWEFQGWVFGAGRLAGLGAQRHFIGKKVHSWWERLPAAIKSRQDAAPKKIGNT